MAPAGATSVREAIRAAKKASRRRMGYIVGANRPPVAPILGGMPAEDLDCVRSVYAEWARGNMAAGPEHFDPEIVFEAFMPDSQGGATAKGLSEIDAFMREFLSQWRDYRL